MELSVERERSNTVTSSSVLDDAGVSGYDAASAALSDMALSQVFPDKDMQDAVTRAVASQPVFVNQMAARLSDRVTGLSKTKNGRPHMLRNVGSVVETRKLQLAYPDFDLSNQYGYNRLGHAFARDARELDTRMIHERFIHYSDDVILGESPFGNVYDTFVKDVGGNVPHHFNRGHSKIHCCNPVIDFQDHVRAEKTMLSYCSGLSRRAVSSFGNRRKVAENLSEATMTCCTSLAQYCTVRAPYVTFIHSSYDIELDDFVTILDRAECRTAYGCFIADASVFFLDKGFIADLECSFRKFRDSTGTLYIEFTFVHDVQLSYVHKFDTYVALLSSATLRSRTSSDVYLVSPEAYTNHTWFFRITRSNGSVVSRQLVVKHLPFSADRDLVYLHTWSYSTLPVAGTNEHISPKRLCVPDVLLRKLTSAAMTLTASKFTVESLRSVAASLNSVEIVSGQSISVDKPVEPDVLEDLVAAVYFWAFVKKFETSKLIETFTSEEQSLRDYYASGLLSRLWKKITGRVNKKAKFSDNAAHPLGDDDIMELDGALPPDAGGGKFWCTRLFWNLLRNERTHPVVLVGGMVRLRFSEVLDEHVVALSKRNLPYIIPPSVSECAFNDVVSKQLLREVLPELPVERRLVPVVYDKQCDCQQLLRKFNVIGDGDCFFHALIKCLDLKCNPFEVRTRLSSSSFMVVFSADNPVKMSLVSDGVTGWASDDVVDLAAAEFGCTICLHVRNEVSPRIFNVGAPVTIHMDFADHHFSPLLPTCVIDTRPIVHIVDMHACVSDVSDDVQIPEYNDLIQPLLTAGVKPSVRYEARSASLRANPLSLTNNFGYGSSYALMLNDLLNENLLPVSADLKVLDVDTKNGSSVQFYADTLKADVTAMSFLPTPMNVMARFNSVQYSPRDVHDIALKLGRMSADYDILSVNPPHFLDEVTALDMDMHNRHLANHIQCLRVLKPGGIAVVSAPIYANARTLQLITSYCKNFEKVVVVKSGAVAPHNPWLLFVCADRNPVVNLDVPVAMEERYELFNFVRHCVLGSVDVHGGICSAVEQLAQVHYQSVVNAVNDIGKELGKPGSSPALPLQQLDLLSTELKVEQNKRLVGGGDVGDLVLTTYVDELQPVAFYNFDKMYVQEVLPGYERTCFTNSFSEILVSYCKGFTSHHMKILEKQFGRTFLVERDMGELMSLVESCGLSRPWVAFYQAFVVSLTASNVYKKRLYLELSLVKQDLMRGTLVTSVHFYRPKFLDRVKFLFAPNLKTFSNNAVSAVVVPNSMCDQLVEYIAERSAPIRTISKVVDAPIVPEPVDEPVVVSTAVVGGDSDPIIERLKLMRRETRSCVKEYAMYLEGIETKLRSNCKAIMSAVESGLSQSVLTVLFSTYEGFALMINKRMVAGSVKTIYSNRYVFAWNAGAKRGDLLCIDDRPAYENYSHICTYSPMAVLTEVDIRPFITAGKGVSTDDIGLVQAAAGCGKTHSIVETVWENKEKNVVVLTSTKQGVDELVDRFESRLGFSRDSRRSKRVSTIDSYLMHSRSRCEVLLVDEALMQHPGKLLAAIVCSGAEMVRLYGDALQIPFINQQKGSIVLSYESAAKLFPVVRILHESRRVPVDICNILSPLYRAMNKPLGFDVGMSSLSQFGLKSPSFKIVMIAGVADVPLPSNDTKVLCFTQSDKLELRNRGFDASTVHEFQGRESDYVCLVRLEAADSNIVFSSQSHAITAITRHRRFLTYFTAGIADDAVTTLLRTGHIRGGGRCDTPVVSAPCLDHCRDHAAADNIQNIVNLNSLSTATWRLLSDVGHVDPVLTRDEIFDHVVVEMESDIAVFHVQTMIDEIFPGTSMNNNHNMQWMFHHSDFKIEVGSVVMNGNALRYLEPSFDKLRPVVRSAIHSTVLQTPRNVLNAIAKRNVNVPKLTCLVDNSAELRGMVNRLLLMCPNTNFSQVTVSAEDIVDWYNDQSINASDLICDVGLASYPLDNYDFVLKANAKPILSRSAALIYPQPQTILFQKKFVNAVFCSLWRIIRDRIMTGLSSKFMIYTGVSPSAFADEMTRRLPPSKCRFLRKIEFDMRKYDKSQGALILEFECELLRKFKVDKQLIDLWRNAHVYCTVKDRKTKLKFHTWFQRKSGDASTFFGNTLALMVMLTDVVDISKIYLGLFAGDDSVVYMNSEPALLDTDIFAQKYNLECKMYEYKYQYFCSKFLVDYNDTWLMVPDPLKRGIKLGRRDLANWKHLEEYRRSLVDDIGVYGNFPVAAATARAVKERYVTNYDCTQAMLGLKSLVMNELAFRDIFYVEPGDILCEDPSLSLLEL